MQVQGQERQGEWKRKRFERKEQVYIDKKGAGKGAFSRKKQRKVGSKERGVKFEDIEKIKGSVEDLLRDLFYLDLI